MQILSKYTTQCIAAGSLTQVLDPAQANCLSAKLNAVGIYYGSEHYDVLEVANSLHASCPFEYPDVNMAIQAAIEPFMMGPFPA